MLVNENKSSLPLPAAFSAAERSAGMEKYTEVKVRGYGEYSRAVEKHQGRPLYALFCGDKDGQGVSWCPDCVTGNAGDYRVRAQH